MKYVSFFLLLLLTGNINATELSLTPTFLGQEKIKFEYIPSSNGGNDLTGTLVSPAGENIPLPARCPSEGGEAQLGNVYTLTSPKKLLIVTCIYQINHSGLGIKGTDYQPLVFEDKNGVPYRRQDIEPLISGYEGSAEDGSRSYFFYNDEKLAALKLKSLAIGQTDDPIYLAHKIVIKRLRDNDTEALAYYVSPQRIAELLKQTPISSKNAGLYNDIGYALSEIGNQREALKILYSVEQVVPDRAVLMLNIADALWISGNKSKSKEYYSKYKHTMNVQNKKSAIPTRVNERLSTD
jgi:hypothetical protein